LSIEIDDEGTPEKPAAAASFTPKSITERTVALGGHVRVGTNAGAGTTLTLRIHL
jgi:signal transduction histidine kinase